MSGTDSYLCCRLRRLFVNDGFSIHNQNYTPNMFIMQCPDIQYHRSSRSLHCCLFACLFVCLCFFITAFTLQRISRERFTLSGLLDKPWSQVFSFPPPPPGTCLYFFIAHGVQHSHFQPFVLVDFHSILTLSRVCFRSMARSMAWSRIRCRLWTC